MTGPINVDVEAMLAAGREFEEKHGTIRGQVTALQGEFDGLSRSWGGDAATAFQSAMHQFYEECDTVLVNLRQIATDVNSSALSYGQSHHMSTDAAVALQRQISTTPAGLPGF